MMRQKTATGRPPYSRTPGDFLVIGLIIIFTLYFYIDRNDTKINGATVSVTRKGNTELVRLPLDKNRKVNLNKYGINMVVEVRDGQVRVASSDCKQQLCVHRGWIKHPAEAIFCLPNEIIVEISRDGARYDAISR